MTETHKDFMVISKGNWSNDYASMFGGISMPKSISIQVTERCNLRCTYCYFYKRRGKDITYAILDKIISMVYTNPFFSDTPSFIFDFIGGEPLLVSDKLQYFIENYYKEGLKRNVKNIQKLYSTRFSMSSNGVLYFSDKTRSLLKRYAHIISFGITLDGSPEMHNKCRIYPNGDGSYADVRKAVDEQLKYNKGLSSKVTFSVDNIHMLYDAIKHLISIGIKTIHANPVFEKGWKIKHAEIYYDELIKLANYILNNDLENKVDVNLFTQNIGKPMDERENSNWCGGTGAMLGIGFDGSIYPCARYFPTALSKYKPPVIGNVFDNKIDWACNKVTKGIDKITRKSQSSKRCWECLVVQGCAWCSAYNYDYYGIINKRTTHICNMHRARVRANYYYWNSVYQKYNMDTEFILYPCEWVEDPEYGY